MLVVKSILSGEFKIEKSPRRRGGGGGRNTKIGETSSMINKYDLYNTTGNNKTNSNNTNENDDDDVSATASFRSCSEFGINYNDNRSDAGSTAVGDSFVVLEVDCWNNTNANNTAHDDSLEDPYLVSKQELQNRLLLQQKQQKDASPSLTEVPTIGTNVEEDNDEGSVYSPCLSTEPISDQLLCPAAILGIDTGDNNNNKTPAKSLGTFTFPTTNDKKSTTTKEDEEKATLSIPLQPNFDKPNTSFTTNEDEDNDDDDDEEDDDDTMHSCSLEVPSTPLLSRSAVIVTPNVSARKRRIVAALEKIEQLKIAIEASSRRIQTAKLFLQLGKEEECVSNYPSAINSYFQSAAIYRHYNKFVALATALDYAAVAYCKACKRGMAEIIHKQSHNIMQFYKCLHEALQIRKNQLGPWHVDTVNTLQHLAQLCMINNKQVIKATEYYLEVVHLRKAIFGINHPSVAVTAHSLGNAYIQIQDLVAAEIWYDYSLNIYNNINLPDNNISVAKLLRDKKRLQRLQSYINNNNLADDENLLFEL